MKQRAGKAPIGLNDRPETSNETNFEKPIKTQAQRDLVKKEVKRQAQQFYELLEQPYTHKVGTQIDSIMNYVKDANPSFAKKLSRFMDEKRSEQLQEKLELQQHLTEHDQELQQSNYQTSNIQTLVLTCAVSFQGNFFVGPVRVSFGPRIVCQG